jgi:pimeloyl-ACP methyl ester carboxylesterase
MKMVKFLITAIFAYGLFLSPIAHADFNVTLPDIELEPGITADINITVFESVSGICNEIGSNTKNDNSIFAVHGLSSDGTVWGPLANALFTNNPTGGIVCRVIAIDMPGHGLSGLPEGGLLFGQMSEGNYANVLLNSLTQLASLTGIRPVAMMAQSNGGMVVQVAQQKLADMGTSFLERYGIQKTTLMAPVPSAPVVWPDQEAFRDAIIFQQNCFGPFVLPSPCEVLDVVPPPNDITWEDLQAIDPATANIDFDCDPFTVPIGVPTILAVPLNCQDPPGNPLGDHIPAGILAAPEPLMILREINGLPPQQRPVTNAGIFSGIENGTFSIIAFQNDLLVGPPSVLEALFNHLTDPSEFDKFQVVEGPLADHSMFVFAPEQMLQAVAGNICFIPIVPIRPIPTLSEWGLIVMVGLLGIVGLIAIRKRYTTA